MNIILIAILCFLGGGLLSLCLARSPAWAARVGVASIVAGSLIGLWPVLRVLAGGGTESVTLPWTISVGQFHVYLDSLSAFFLAPIFVLSPLAAVYGGQYMMAHRERNSLRSHWFLLSLFVSGMTMVVVARDVVLFMIAWEVMSVSAFFLVTFEHEQKDVRMAGWIYLIAAHLGAAFLLAMFLTMGRHAGSLDFDKFMAPGLFSGSVSAVIFFLGLIGFGTKAGLVPLHIWLPEAHPAAPSHVSALMSGVMIKIGLYGILRTMMFLGAPAVWWGIVLVGVGLTGAVIGVSLALFQRDVKRALAYSSIENIGLIVMAIGVGLWGQTTGHPLVAILGLAGGLLHIWNHSMMKALMFLGSGSILHGAGTKDMERLGGLMKHMPRTGVVMVLGALAIAAIPPLNGFVSEWLIYMAMLNGGLEFLGVSGVVLLMMVGILALIGGLAMICFVRLIGIVLLGEGRSEEALHAHESSGWMTVPMGILAAFCVAAAVFPRALISMFARTIQAVFSISPESLMGAMDSAKSPLGVLSGMNAVVWIGLGVIALLFLLVVRRGRVSADATWGCGYLAPTSRMQYTGQSFSELIVSRLFPQSFRPKSSVETPRGLFPDGGKMTTGYPDTLSRIFYRPFFDWLVGRFIRLHWVQMGNIHYYMIYFVVMLLALFAWLVIRGWMGL